MPTLCLPRSRGTQRWAARRPRGRCDLQRFRRTTCKLATGTFLDPPRLRAHERPGLAVHFDVGSVRELVGADHGASGRRRVRAGAVGDDTDGPDDLRGARVVVVEKGRRRRAARDPLLEVGDRAERLPDPDAVDASRSSMPAVVALGVLEQSRSRSVSARLRLVSPATLRWRRETGSVWHDGHCAEDFGRRKRVVGGEHRCRRARGAALLEPYDARPGLSHT
jgi:hypothetical protein